jgi:hypothetical protein
MEILEIPKRLYGDHRPGHGIFVRDRLFQIKAHNLPGASAQACQKASIQHEINPQPLGDGKHPLPVRHAFENIFTEPLSEFDHTLLMTGWTEMSALTRKC